MALFNVTDLSTPKMLFEEQERIWRTGLTTFAKKSLALPFSAIVAVKKAALFICMRHACLSQHLTESQ